MAKAAIRKSALAMLALASVLAAGPIAPARADDGTTDATIQNVLGDAAVYRKVILAFQSAVKAGDAAGVAALVNYPITVSINGKKQRIANPRDFTANYDAIITPAIAAAVEKQRYKDLFVNSQGVMFGDGEVWINGICRDKACNTFDARIITIQAGPGGNASVPAAAEAPAPAPAAAVTSPQKAGVLKSFKDWAVGCDNIRSCIAVGMSPDPDAMSGYVKLSRSGEPDAAPTVEFVTWPDDENAKAATPTIRLSLDAHKAGGVPDGPLAGTDDGDFVRLSLTADQTADFLAALRSAKLVTIDLYDGAKRIGHQQVSLAGSSAALLYMDDEQKRIGTVTALAKPGKADASTMPPVPAAPVVAAQKIAEMPDPLPAAPKSIGKPSEDDCGTGPAPYAAFTLGDGAALWGVCDSAGAYNVSYRFSIVRPDGNRPARFIVPGAKPEDDGVSLGNPYVADDGLTLGSFNKGRGLGDCGDAADWAFDGKAFQPLAYSYMDQCRGVMQEDWPVLYQAKKG